MARDIGRYFEQMTKRARGGRRSDPASPGGRRSGRVGRAIDDIVRTGRSTATSAGRKARERVRRRPTRRRPAERSRTLPPEGVVTVEYSPQLDGDPDPGEVVWTWVPFEEDPDQGKDRPVVVIGRRGRHLVGVPLTTRHDDREAQIGIGTGDWDPQRRPSYARIWRMLDIDPDTTRREGAVLRRDRFDALIAAVDEYYDIRRPSSAAATLDRDG